MCKIYVNYSYILIVINYTISLLVISTVLTVQIALSLDNQCFARDNSETHRIFFVSKTATVQDLSPKPGDKRGVPFSPKKFHTRIIQNI